MIKLSIEIEGNNFKYDYSVGECTHRGEHPISPEGLIIFTNCLNMVQRAYVNQHEDFMEKIKARGFLERHYPDLEKIVRERERKETKP